MAVKFRVSPCSSDDERVCVLEGESGTQGEPFFSPVFVATRRAPSHPSLRARTHRPGPSEDSQILPGIEAGTRRGTESAARSDCPAAPLLAGSFEASSGETSALLDFHVRLIDV